jgi:hypothetical protein
MSAHDADLTLRQIVEILGRGVYAASPCGNQHASKSFNVLIHPYVEAT